MSPLILVDKGFIWPLQSSHFRPRHSKDSVDYVFDATCFPLSAMLDAIKVCP